MKITGSNGVQPKSLKKTSKKSPTGGASFAGELSGTESAQETANISGAGPLASVGALIGLQEVPDATTSRSKGLARADEMLDMLEEVRKGLLLGAIPEKNLRMLADMARHHKEDAQDKVLNEILADIELRAEVELAKLGY